MGHRLALFPNQVRLSEVSLGAQSEGLDRFASTPPGCGIGQPVPEDDRRHHSFPDVSGGPNKLPASGVETLALLFYTATTSLLGTLVISSIPIEIAIGI